MKNLKNLKFTNKIKNIGNKFKWFLFTEIQDFKLTSEYIDFICPENNKVNNPIENLETMVRQTLIREFSPDIVNSKSFDLIVETAMYKIQKEELGEDAFTEETLAQL